MIALTWCLFSSVLPAVSCRPQPAPLCCPGAGLSLLLWPPCLGFSSCHLQRGSPRSHCSPELQGQSSALSSRHPARGLARLELSILVPFAEDAEVPGTSQGCSSRQQPRPRRLHLQASPELQAPSLERVPSLILPLPPHASHNFLSPLCNVLLSVHRATVLPLRPDASCLLFISASCPTSSPRRILPFHRHPQEAAFQPTAPTV